jgi:hypothetical protein
MAVIWDTPTKMAAKLKIEKGDEINKKSSPLKLESQSQPNFAEMIFLWSPFKIVSVSAVFLICIIGQNRQKFKVHKKLRNIC